MSEEEETPKNAHEDTHNPKRGDGGAEMGMVQGPGDPAASGLLPLPAVAGVN
jgi:hypothetical protein